MKIEDYITSHKNNICYCEAVIYDNGEIEDANPSHLYKLIDISGKSFDEISAIMPMQAGPVAWLVDYTNCCSIWYDMGMLPENLTIKQEESIEKLKQAGILSSKFVAIKNYEMKICEYHNILSTTNDEKVFNDTMKKLNDICYEKG